MFWKLVHGGSLNNIGLEVKTDKESNFIMDEMFDWDKGFGSVKGIFVHSISFVTL